MDDGAFRFGIISQPSPGSTTGSAGGMTPSLAMVVPEIDLEIVILFESYLDGEEGFCAVVIVVDHFTSFLGDFKLGCCS